MQRNTYVYMLASCACCLQSFTMENTHTFPVDFEWALSSPVFSVSPVSGTVKPKSSCSVAVRWTPGTATAAAAASPRLQSKVQHTAESVSAAGLDKLSSKKQAGKGAAAEVASSAPVTAAGGKAAASGDSKSGSNGGGSGNTAITVQLPSEAAADPAAAAVGCQHTSFMTLKLKGGADSAPKKVMLHGELPAGMLKFKEKEVNLGPVPLGCQQTAVVQLKNAGIAEASYRVSGTAPGQRVNADAVATIHPGLSHAGLHGLHPGVLAPLFS